MQEIEISQIIFYVLPAVVVGIISFYFFSNYMTNEENRRIYELKKENSKNALPQRLQALERMTLFLERIHPGSLLIRVKPIGSSKHDYENLLIRNIEQEFEHNLAQQIYVTDKCWGAIKATKNATISLIRQTNMSDKVDSPDKLREMILSDLVDKKAPSETGLAFLKNEVREIW